MLNDIITLKLPTVHCTLIPVRNWVSSAISSFFPGLSLSCVRAKFLLGLYWSQKWSRKWLFEQLLTDRDYCRQYEASSKAFGVKPVCMLHWLCLQLSHGIPWNLNQIVVCLMCMCQIMGRNNTLDIDGCHGITRNENQWCWKLPM